MQSCSTKLISHLQTFLSEVLILPVQSTLHLRVLSSSNKLHSLASLAALFYLVFFFYPASESSVIQGEVLTSLVLVSTMLVKPFDRPKLLLPTVTFSLPY